MTTLRELLAGPTLEVAPRLLGMRLRTEFEGLVSEVALNEVEAYLGPDDPASHSYRGPTDRNASMFLGPGTLYVYRSYGIHWCANIVTGPVGRAEAVLLRGGVPTAGAAVMAARRGRSDHLSDGPGKLCRALAIDRTHDGTNVIEGPVRLLAGTPPAGVTSTRRIGISKAVDHKWRFVPTN